MTICATLFYVGWYSNLLIVKTIEVRGANEISAETIVASSEVPLNLQLARVQIGSAVEKIKTISQISTVDIRRGWPSTLVIVVSERIPLATTDTSGGKFLVDESGVAYLLAPEVTNLPVVSAADDPARAFAIKAWQSFPEWLKQEVLITGTEPTNSAWLMLTSGRKVIWGSLEKADQKAAVLKVLRRMAASAYDVSTPEVPVVKP